MDIRLLTTSLVLCAVFLPCHVMAWDTFEEDGHCCTMDVAFEINNSSFRDTPLELANFPNYYSVLDQVATAANYWNDAGSAFNLRRGGDTTQCTTNRDICSVPADTPELQGYSAVTHWTRGSCLCYGGCAEIAIQTYYVLIDGEVDWRTHAGDGGPNFSSTMTHEFGHVLALAHNFSEYNAIQMSYGTSRGLNPRRNIRSITEDDAYGLDYIHGHNKEYLRFKSAKLNENGPHSFSTTEQQETDANHKTYAMPSIAINPDESSTRTFDFAVAWTRASDHAICYELIKMNSINSHSIVSGPLCFAGYTSWQGPSIAVNTDGAVAIAYRYEKENPNVNNLTELNRNSMLRLIVSNSSRSVHYNVEPKTCANELCRTINNPSISFNWGKNRWLLAFTENAPSDDEIGEMHSVSVLVSNDASGLYWSKPPLRTGYHSYWAPPAINCDSAWGFGRCLLVYPSWDRADGWMARTYQAVVKVDPNEASGLSLIPDGSFEWGASGFGHLGLAGSSFGWLMTRLNTPAVEYDDMTWSFKYFGNGISDSWTSQGNWNGTESEKGYAVACNYFPDPEETWCRFVWERE